MSEILSGGCMCGEIRYEVKGKPVVTAYCHCRDCQRTAGGPFSVVTVVRREDLEVTQGEPKAYIVKGASGKEVKRLFCSNCGSPLFSDVESNPRVWILKTGSLDDPNPLKPSMHVWTETALEWAPIEKDIPIYDRDPV